MSRAPRAGEPGKLVNVRVTDAERTLWKKAARASSKTLSDWLREVANREASWIPGAEALARKHRSKKR